MERDERMERLAKQWQIAGLVLRRVNPIAFVALLHAAEVTVAETPEAAESISATVFFAEEP